MKREELETDEDRAAFDLCEALGVDPFTCVPVGTSQFCGYEGDYFMNWARGRVEEYALIRKFLPDGK